MKGNKIFKATFIIMIVGILSRSLGMIRDGMVGNIFGSNMYTDAYKAAVTIPETVFMLIGLGISTVFIPMLSKIKHEKSKEEMFNFSNNVISILSIISLILFIIGFFFSKEIVSFFATGFKGERLALASFLTKITLINLLFLSINSCYVAMLQVCEDFVIPSIIGVFFNAPIIIYLLCFKSIDIVGLTIANVIGNFFRVLIQLPSLYKNGYRLRFKVNFKDERIKRTLILLGPVIIGAGANSLNMVVDTNVASTLSVGGLSIVDYAQKIITFANTAITTSIVSVMYPLMANKLNSKDKEGFILYLSKSITIIALLLIPISIGFIILNKEIVRLLYGWGQFTNEDINLTALALVGYCLAIPFTGIRDILNSSLFSMEKTKITTINGVIGVIANIILSITLVKYLGVFGIALASSISSMLIAILLFKSIRKILGEFDIFTIIKKIIKIVVAAIIMFIVLISFNYFIELKLFSKIIVNGLLGAIIYFVSCYILNLEEVKDIIMNVKAKVLKKEGN